MSKFLPYLCSGGIALILSLFAFKENLFYLSKHETVLAGDGLLLSYFFRIILQSSWWDFFSQSISSAQFGWPNGVHLSLYPVGNLIDFTALKIMHSIFPYLTEGVLLHMFVVIRFSLISVCALFFFQRIIHNNSLSVICSLFFAFIPFNLIRSEGHFVLGSTWTIPLGLAALHKIWIDSRETNFRNKDIAKSSFLLIIVGLNNFYFAFFIAILGMAYSVLSITLSFLTKQQEDQSKMGLPKIFKSCTFFLPTLFGLSIQIIPNMLSKREYSIFYNTSARSPIEPIAYAGSLESLFSDSTTLVLRTLKRQDLIAYLQTRVSWEGTQSGSITGLSLYILLLVFFFTFFVKSKACKSVNDKFLAFGLLASIFLYLPSPVNFGISYLLNPIRAWGRVTPIIALLAISLLFSIISKTRKSIVIYFSLTAFILIGLQDIVTFRNSRPEAQALNEQAIENKFYLKKFMDEIPIPDGCPVVSLPIYPHPEFDVGYDNAIDYAYLELPMGSNRNVKWSIGSMKGSKEFYWLENLQSQVPPFNRVNILDQIKYVMLSNPCALILDKLMLSNNEWSIFEGYLNAFPKNASKTCVIQDKKWSRFFAVVLEVPECKEISKYIHDSSNETLVKSLYEEWENGKFMWRNVTPGGLKFVGFQQWFSARQSFQSFDFYSTTLGSTKNSSSPTAVIEIVNKGVSSSSNQLCIKSSLHFPTQDCLGLNVEPKETVIKILPLTNYLNGARGKIQFDLVPTNGISNDSLEWSIIITESQKTINILTNLS